MFRSGLLELERWPEEVWSRTVLRWAAVLLVGAVTAIAGGVLTAAVHPLAGFGVLFAGLLGLAILSHAQVGIFTVVGVAYLLPFARVPVPVGGLYLTFLDLSLSAVLLVWVLRLAVQRERGLVSTPLNALLLVFIGLALVSFTFGIQSVRGELLRFFLKTINSLLFFFTVVNTVTDRRRLYQVVGVILAGGLSAALLGLGVYALPVAVQQRVLDALGALGYPTGEGVVRYIASTTTLRAVGTAVDPNVLGGMLMLVIPLTVAQVFGRAPLLSRRWLVPVLAAMLAAIILTYSRSSWAGAVAGVFLVAVVKYRRAWLLVALMALALWLTPWGDVVVGRFISGVRVEDQAAQMRLGEYRDALRLISLYPWFGVGFGQAPSIDLYVVASSIYLLIAEEMGLIGLSAFLALVGVLLLYAVRALRSLREPRLETVQLGLLASVVAALTAGLFDHYFFNLHFPHTIALFWLFVGLTVVASRLALEGERDAGSPLPSPALEE